MGPAAFAEWAKLAIPTHFAAHLESTKTYPTHRYDADWIGMQMGLLEFVGIMSDKNG